MTTGRHPPGEGDRRVEFILRVPNLTPAAADKAQGLLTTIAEKFGGRLSRIERNHYGEYAVHASRRDIVRSRAT